MHVAFTGRHQHVVWALVARRGREPTFCFARRHHSDDPSAVDRERKPLLDEDLRLDAKCPAGTDQGVDSLHRHGDFRFDFESIPGARERRASIAARRHANATGA
jgi:hypothetical protein